MIQIMICPRCEWLFIGFLHLYSYLLVFFKNFFGGGKGWSLRAPQSLRKLRYCSCNLPQHARGDPTLGTLCCCIYCDIPVEICEAGGRSAAVRDQNLPEKKTFVSPRKKSEMFFCFVFFPAFHQRARQLTTVLKYDVPTVPNSQRSASKACPPMFLRVLYIIYNTRHKHLRHHTSWYEISEPIFSKICLGGARTRKMVALQPCRDLSIDTSLGVRFFFARF